VDEAIQMPTGCKMMLTITMMYNNKVLGFLFIFASLPVTHEHTARAIKHKLNEDIR